MKNKGKVSLTDLGQKVFKIKDEPMPRGAWWWWFWLFFIDNPKNPDKPRQLMILWSAKNTKEIQCNHLKLRLDTSRSRDNLDGAVAAWYFDGEKMHHNFLLEQCNLRITDNELSSDSTEPTSFSVDGATSKVKIGKDFEFVAKPRRGHSFTTPTYYPHTYVGGLGYSILRLNNSNLTGRIKGEPIQGTAYFQRVFVNAPAVPWYWGVFHFEKGAVLTYFRPYLLGKPLKKEISLFDGKETHMFKDIKIKKSGRDTPGFTVSGENKNEKIKFTVASYSHSSWRFRKKSFGFVPTSLTYNEYPSTISELELVDKRTGGVIGLHELGRSVGNAEHTTGLLL